MENIIGLEIEDLIKGVQGLPSTQPLNAKIENNDFSSEMISINKLYDKIINNTEYLKCLLVLTLKKVTWHNELRDKFDIGSRTIEYFIDNMKCNGFIYTKQLIEIDNILYETLLTLNNESFYKQSHNINLITLSSIGESFVKKVVEDCIKLQREDIIFTINEINNKTLSFRKIYDKIKDKENVIGNRIIKYPDGTIIERDTLANNKLKKDIKVSLLELKTDILLEHNPQSTEIALITETKSNLSLNNTYSDKEEKSVYTGMFSNLNSVQIENIMQPITDKDVKELEKDYKKEIKSKIDYLNDDKYSINKVLNKELETKQDIKRNKSECSSFLDSLYSEHYVEEQQEFNFKGLTEKQRLTYLNDYKISIDNKKEVLKDLDHWYLEMLYVNSKDYYVDIDCKKYRYVNAVNILQKYLYNI